MQKYKCRDDRRVVLMLNRNAVVVKKFFEERAGKPSPYIKIKKKAKNREISWSFWVKNAKKSATSAKNDFVETLHATSFFSSNAMNNKKRRNMLRLYKRKKSGKNREISWSFWVKTTKRVQNSAKYEEGRETQPLH